MRNSKIKLELVPGQTVILKGSSAGSLIAHAKDLETRIHDEMSVKLPQEMSIGTLTGLNSLAAGVFATYGERVCPECGGLIPSRAALVDADVLSKRFMGVKIAISDNQRVHIIDRFTFSGVTDPKFKEALRIGSELNSPLGLIATLEGEERKETIAFRPCCLSCGYEPSALGSDLCELALEGRLKKGSKNLDELMVNGVRLCDARLSSISSFLELLLDHGESEKLEEFQNLARKLGFADLHISARIGDILPEIQECIKLVIGLLSEESSRTFIFYDLSRNIDSENVALIEEIFHTFSKRGNSILLLDIENAFPEDHPAVLLLQDAAGENSFKTAISQSKSADSIAILYNVPRTDTQIFRLAVQKYAQGKTARISKRTPVPLRATIAGYLGVAPILADQYASLPDAVLHGITRNEFLKLCSDKMHLVRFKGVAMDQALGMSIGEFTGIFGNLPKMRKLSARINNSLLREKPLTALLGSLSTAEWRMLSLIHDSLGAKEGDVLYIEDAVVGMGKMEVEGSLSELVSQLRIQGIRVVLADSNRSLLHLQGVVCVPEKEFLESLESYE